MHADENSLMNIKYSLLSPDPVIHHDPSGSSLTGAYPLFWRNLIYYSNKFFRQLMRMGIKNDRRRLA
jgi:hypothetical protein